MERFKLMLPSHQDLMDLGIPSTKQRVDNTYVTRSWCKFTDLVVVSGGVTKEYREWKSDFYKETCVIATSNPQTNETGKLSIRPVIESEEIYEELRKTATADERGRLIVEFGEYPQWAVSDETRESIEKMEHDLVLTGRTFDICQERLKEYTYNGSKIVKAKFTIEESPLYRDTLDAGLDSRRLSVAKEGRFNYRDGDSVWLEVLPVRWIVDDKNKRLIAKSALIAIDAEAIYDFMKTKMVNDMFQSVLVRSQSKESELLQGLIARVMQEFRKSYEDAKALGKGDEFVQQILLCMGKMVPIPSAENEKNMGIGKK